MTEEQLEGYVEMEGPALALWVMMGLESMTASCLSASLRSLPTRVTASSPHPIPGCFGSCNNPFGLSVFSGLEKGGVKV